MVASRRAVTWKHSLFFLKKQSLLISKTKQSNPFYLNNTITTAWNIQYIFFLCFPYQTFEISHVLVFSILLSALSHFFALSSEPPVTLDGSYWWLKRRLLNKFSRSLFTFSFFSESGCAQPFVPFDDAKVMTFPCSKQTFPPFSFKILLFFDAYQEWCVRTQSFFYPIFK